MSSYAYNMLGWIGTTARGEFAPVPIHPMTNGANSPRDVSFYFSLWNA